VLLHDPDLQQIGLCLGMRGVVRDDWWPLAPQVSQIGDAAPIEREAVTLPLDHTFGFELADVGPAAIKVQRQCRYADSRGLAGPQGWIRHGRAIIADSPFTYTVQISSLTYVKAVGWLSRERQPFRRKRWLALIDQTIVRGLIKKSTITDSRRCDHSATAFCRGLLPASRMRYAVRDEPCMTRLTTMAAMPASTAFACGDASMSMIGFDGCAGS
jgi:hypothetical protein